MNTTAHLEQSRPVKRDAPQPLSGATVLCQGDIDIDALLSAKVRYVFEWWHRAGGGVLPYWSQFDITEHAKIVANAFLVKRNAAGAWFFVVKGEAVHELFPSHKTPEPIANRQDIKWSADLADYYDQIAATGRCHVVRGTIANERNEMAAFESIDCPFREGALGQVAILGVIEKITAR